MKIFKTDYNESYFDTTIDHNPFIEKEIKEKIKLIESYKKKGKLLEIGCGVGDLLNKLQTIYNVKGIDISKHAIDKASKKIDKKKLMVLDIEKENIKDNFDIVIAFDVMEHLKRPKEVLKKIKNILNKNGILIFSVPNNYGFFGKIMTRVFNFIDKTHISTYRREKWIKIIKKLDFDIDIINHGIFGFRKDEKTKHFSYNVVFIAKKNN